MKALLSLALAFLTSPAVAGFFGPPGGSGSSTAAGCGVYGSTALYIDCASESVGISSVPGVGVLLQVGTTNLTVLKNGNMGIGTTSPAANFDLKGTVRLSSSATANPYLASDTNGVVRIQAGGVSTGTVGGTVFHQDYRTAASTTNPDTSELAFSTFTIPANILARDGDCIRYICALSAAAASSVLYVRLQGELITRRTSGALAVFAAHGLVCRAGASGQIITGDFSSANPWPVSTTANSNASTMSLACGGSSASVGGVSYVMMRAVYEPAP
mgnify:CR=1 FL=1